MTPKEEKLADTLRKAGVTLIEASTAFELCLRYGNEWDANQTLHNAQVALNEAQGQLRLHWVDDATRLKESAK